MYIWYEFTNTGHKNIGIDWEKTIFLVHGTYSIFHHVPFIKGGNEVKL